MKRYLVVALALLVVGSTACWYWQSELIGLSSRWYLQRVAAREEHSGDLRERRQVVAHTNRLLLMPPPDDALVPELFDLVTQLSARIATGEVSLGWAAYVFTTYQRDLTQQRPTGMPRRSPEEVGAELARYVEFFSIQKRPDQRGYGVQDIMGTGDDVITLEEIEESERSGKEIDLRTRGAQ